MENISKREFTSACFRAMIVSMNQLNNRKSIENWLNNEGITYSELASKLSVPESFIKKWISQKEIPQEFLSCIQNLMNDSTNTKITCIEESRETGIKLDISLSDYVRLCKHAVDSGCSVGELIARELDALSKTL